MKKITVFIAIVLLFTTTFTQAEKNSKEGIQVREAITSTQMEQSTPPAKIEETVSPNTNLKLVKVFTTESGGVEKIMEKSSQLLGTGQSPNEMVFDGVYYPNEGEPIVNKCISFPIIFKNNTKKTIWKARNVSGSFFSGNSGWFQFSDCKEGYTWNRTDDVTIRPEESGILRYFIWYFHSACILEWFNYRCNGSWIFFLQTASSNQWVEYDTGESFTCLWEKNAATGKREGTLHHPIKKDNKDNKKKTLETSEIIFTFTFELLDKVTTKDQITQKDVETKNVYCITLNAERNTKKK